MATNYPGSLDSLTNPASTDRLTSPSHAAQHANANDAIEAIQATLGTNPQGSESTVGARIAALEGGGGVSVVAIAATGTTSINDTPTTKATTASFTTSTTKDLAVSFTLGADFNATVATDLITTTIEVVNDEAAVVATSSLVVEAQTADQHTRAITFSAAFADVVADTYTVRVKLDISGGTGTRNSVSGFVLY